MDDMTMGEVFTCNEHAHSNINPTSLTLAQHEVAMSMISGGSKPIIIHKHLTERAEADVNMYPPPSLKQVQNFVRNYRARHTNGRTNSWETLESIALEYSSGVMPSSDDEPFCIHNYVNRNNREALLLFTMVCL